MPPRGNEATHPSQFVTTQAQLLWSIPIFLTFIIFSKFKSHHVGRTQGYNGNTSSVSLLKYFSGGADSKCS